MKYPKSTLFTSQRRGLSLTELVIVLGISSLLIGASLAWFSSQRTVNFYDQMRQIESQIRKVQSDAQSNIAPGFVAKGDCDARDDPSSTCVLKVGEEIFGTAISVQNQAASLPAKMRIYYLKSTNPALSPYNRPQSVVPYGPIANYSEDVTLPADMRFLGYRVYGHTLVGGVYTCRLADSGLIKWPLPTTADGQNNPVLQNDIREVTGVSGYSTMVFRRQPNSYYTLWDAATTGVFTAGSVEPPFRTPPVEIGLGPVSGVRFVTTKTSAERVLNGGGYAYYDQSATIPFPAEVTNKMPLGTQPCAVAWKFGTVEQSGGQSRFTAEIVFDIPNSTIRLVTR